MKNIFFIFILLIVFSCKKEEQIKIEKSKISDNISLEDLEELNDFQEDIVLDWEGSYVGILPCEDCQGRNTEIILSINHTFSKSTLYMKKNKEEVDENGKFLWLDDGCTIVLNDKDKTKIKVGLNKLTVLKPNGKKYKDNPEEYILLKNICEDKDFEEYSYEGNDKKKYSLIFGQGCDGLFAEVKSENFSLLLFRETASEFTTTYGNVKGVKLIDQHLKATLYLEDKDIELTPTFDEK